MEEARLFVEAGVDAIAAQGAEAGAHRGTFAGDFEESMVPTLELVRAIAGFATVIASGGIMNAKDVGLMLANGASAVQMGTAFLTCPESGASPSYKAALLNAGSDTTAITRAFSGRPARGLRNEFIERSAHIEPLPFPVQNTLTRPMRTAGRSRASGLSITVGRPGCRAMQGNARGGTRAEPAVKQWLVALSVPRNPRAARAAFAPHTAQPSRYRLSLSVDLSAKTFTGEETVDLRLAQPSAAIVLNSLDLEITSAEIIAGRRPETAAVAYDRPAGDQRASPSVRKQSRPAPPPCASNLKPRWATISAGSISAGPRAAVTPSPSSKAPTPV